MSDWDFLHDMNHEGYSPDQIADAAVCGYNPYDPFNLVDIGYDPDEWEVVDHDIHDECNPELVIVFENLVHNAKQFHSLTNRYLQIWGELGELFAEITYGIQRHKPHTKGSDGKLGNDFVEIKTISPEKKAEEVRVKRGGNFNKLLIVKIDRDFSFDGQLIARKDLSKDGSTHLRASWSKK